MLGYIADFYIPARKLVVEIDGGSHGWAGRAETDARRDGHLAARGIRTLRIPEVMACGDPAAAVALIEEACLAT